MNELFETEREACYDEECLVADLRQALVEGADLVAEEAAGACGGNDAHAHLGADDDEVAGVGGNGRDQCVGIGRDRAPWGVPGVARVDPGGQPSTDVIDQGEGWPGRRGFGEDFRRICVLDGRPARRPSAAVLGDALGEITVGGVGHRGGEIAHGAARLDREVLGERRLPGPRAPEDEGAARRRGRRGTV